MKTRPWPLVILAAFQMLSPVTSIATNCWLLKVGPYAYLNAIFAKPALQIVDFFLVMPIAGIAIYCMKRWSYPVFLAALLWSAAANFFQFSAHPGLIPISWLISVYAVNLALVAYFLIPEVRTTYLDPGVRWWESKPRYYINIPARYRFDENTGWIESTISNISESGVFLEITRPALPVPHVAETIQLQFQLVGFEINIPGKIIYITPNRALWRCGVKLLHAHGSRKRLSRMLRALELLDVPRRPERGNWLASLKSWCLQAVHSGEGWLPQLPPSHPAVWGSAKIEKPQDKVDAA